MAKIVIHKLDPEFVDEETFINSLSTVMTLEELTDLRDSLYTTKQINRRLKKNREMIMRICSKVTERAYQLIDLGAVPF